MIEDTHADCRPRRATPCVSESDLCRPGHGRFEGPAKRAVETGRNRLLAAGAAFLLAFAAVAGRLVDLALFQQGGEPRVAAVQGAAPPPPLAAHQRAAIVDRNGVVLATNLTTASLYGDPREIIDPVEAARRLSAVLSELNVPEAVARLASDRHFVWLQRHLTPRQQDAVNELGIPGLHFQADERRVYPHARLAGHVLGFTGIDNRGLAGIERYFDARLRGAEGDGGPLRLSLDIRVQHILHEELAAAVEEQAALGGSGLILDVTNGEVLAMVSLPDFDPNHPAEASPLGRFNRNTLGVYEMGSTFKIFTTAMALEYGATTLDELYDVAKPIRVARYTINDYHVIREPVTVSDIFVQSSNIGAVQLALAVGTVRQQEFLRRLGLFRRPAIELPEIGTPLRPDPWREINTMTVAFGHGVAVTPVQMAAAVAAVANGGTLHRPTLLAREPGADVQGKRVLSEATSHTMRRLMRRVVLEGTGRNADVPGYEIGGKTGTAEKPGRGGYSRRRLLSSFVGVFPIADPRYLVLVLLDEPHGVGGNSRRATGGWVAAPVVAQVVRRAGMLLGIPPHEPIEPETPIAHPIIKVNAGGRAIASQ